MKSLRPLAAALLLLASGMAQAQAPVREAPALVQDPVLERRVNEISTELRCVVCQNQTIADSQAGLATDLKNQIREQLKAGRSEREILAFMVDRYGDFVLYRPPLKASTVLLWAGPFLLLVVGAVAGVRVVRRHRGPAAGPQPLTEAQRQQAARRLADEGEPRS